MIDLFYLNQICSIMDKKKLLGLFPHIQKSHTGLQRTQNHNIQFFQLKKCSKKATRQSYNINKRIIAYQSCPAKVNAHRIMIGFKLNFVETKERIWQFCPVVWCATNGRYHIAKKSSLICQTHFTVDIGPHQIMT